MRIICLFSLLHPLKLWFFFILSSIHYVSSISHSSPNTHLNAESLPLSIPHSKSLYGPRFSSPYFSITCCAACNAPFHISGCTVSAPFSIRYFNDRCLSNHILSNNSSVAATISSILRGSSKYSKSSSNSSVSMLPLF